MKSFILVNNYRLRAIQLPILQHINENYVTSKIHIRLIIKYYDV